jgi:hypothetical protein
MGSNPNKITIMEVGNIVKISEKSEYYGLSEYNPGGIEGKITKITKCGDHDIKVEWNNGHLNSYNESDLELVNQSTNNLFPIY